MEQNITPTDPVSTSTPNPSTIPTPATKSAHKKIMILFVCLFILIILTFATAAGIFFYKDMSRKSEVKVVPPSSPTPMLSADMSTWKTYNGEGFSIKYPQDGMMQSTSNSPVFMSKYSESSDGCFDVRIEILENQNITNIKDWITTDSISYFANMEKRSQIQGEIQIYNGSAPGYWYIGGTSTTNKIAIFQTKNTVYKITMFGYRGAGSHYSSCPINDKILSTFKLINTSPTDSVKCVVGGCSGQLCVEASKADGMVSTCEYTPSYACYKSATCEQQVSGECGWTQTEELTACLKNPGN